jgi:hypothetical protein
MFYSNVRIFLTVIMKQDGILVSKLVATDNYSLGMLSFILLQTSVCKRHIISFDDIGRVPSEQHGMERAPMIVIAKVLINHEFLYYLHKGTLLPHWESGNELRDLRVVALK